MVKNIKRMKPSVESHAEDRQLKAILKAIKDDQSRDYLRAVAYYLSNTSRSDR